MNAWNYETIKELATANKQPITDLIALSRNNDPFYMGTDGDMEKARWFADLWERFGFTSGVHLRRAHYRIISQETPVAMPNGLPYENTEKCWDFLGVASKAARYLNLVRPDAFVDRRNPEVMIFTQPSPLPPTVEVATDSWGLDLSLPDFPDLPEYRIDGYNPTQRYHVEIWCEKSTMNEVLLPLARQYGVNIQTGVGELSITACLSMVNRAGDRPVRILYVSDFDPAGLSMPVAVARKVEYFLRNEETPADIQLSTVVLTPAQVAEYRLPRTPIKETEKRAAHFEERYGEGAVELDALEALYPGVLRRILQTEILRYYDDGLAGRVYAARNALRDKIDDVWQAVTATYEDRIDGLRTEYEAIQSEFQQRVTGAQRDITELWRSIIHDLEVMLPDIDDYPIPEAKEAELDAGALYDSRRDYLTQIDAYKAFQGKS